MPGKANNKNFNYVVSVIALYWVVSISMVYLNKILMTSDERSIPAPLFVTWFQCVFTCAICYVCGGMGSYNRRKGVQSSFFLQFPEMVYSAHHAQSTIVLSCIFVGMISFNNLTLNYVEVSFYNVARSLTIIFNVIFTYFILGNKTSTLTLGTLFVVFIGFYVGTDGEVNFSAIGVACGIMASVFVSLNAIFTKRTLPLLGNDQWLLSYVNNANASFLFLPLIVMFEKETILLHWEKFYDPIFWVGMSMAGFLGFSIGIVTVMQIKATSPLGHNISGTAKAAVQSILAFYIWKNEYTAKGLFGIFLVLFGSFLYAYVQMKDRDKNVTLPATSPTK